MLLTLYDTLVTRVLRTRCACHASPNIILYGRKERDEGPTVVEISCILTAGMRRSLC